MFPSVPLFLSLSPTPSLYTFLPSLTLTLSDNVSMLSRINPPLRGVKALPLFLLHLSLSHSLSDAHTHTETQTSFSLDPVRYRSAVQLPLMGFFTPKLQKCLMHRITSDGLMHTHTWMRRVNYGKQLSPMASTVKSEERKGGRGYT